MRTKKAFYNSVAGIFYYLLATLFNILNRKVLINTLGIEYLGINSLFGDILSLLSISELGIGACMTYYLYTPLKENNTSMTRVYLNLFRICYLFISVFILCAGLLLIPLLPQIAKGIEKIPVLPIPVYLIFLFDYICSYIIMPKRCLLIADQNNYIVLLCDMIYQVVFHFCQIQALILTKNFYLYLGVRVFFHLINNLVLSIICHRKYPYISRKIMFNIKQTAPDGFQKRIQGGIYHRIATFIVQGSNSIILTRFWGLSVTGIYSNYALILTALNQLLDYVISAANAGVGQILAKKDTAKSNDIFQQLLLLNFGLVNFITTGFYCCVSPLTELLFGNTSLVSKSTVLAMTIYCFFFGMRKVFHMFKEASGIFFEDRYIALAESLLNVFASVLLVQKWGICGIFWGSIISFSVLYFYTYPVLVCKRALSLPYITYGRVLLEYSIVLSISLLSTRTVINCLGCKTAIIELLLSCICSFIIPNILFILYAKDNPSFHHLLSRMMNLLQIKSRS